ncbi:unnamed protein product [Protopolystoma xenopodis]|uniref:Uncharacterized protein n=1 Tax=Protopolystoma xenopodis TaxID=117903 RepID=A0A3S5A7D9_9PLAT|nr:unnamed protein product [Protopolystoma xenopodis]
MTFQSTGCLQILYRREVGWTGVGPSKQFRLQGDPPTGQEDTASRLGLSELDTLRGFWLGDYILLEVVSFRTAFYVPEWPAALGRQKEEPSSEPNYTTSSKDLASALGDAVTCSDVPVGVNWSSEMCNLNCPVF